MSFDGLMPPKRGDRIGRGYRSSWTATGHVSYWRRRIGGKPHRKTGTEESSHDRVQLAVTALPGIAAVIALIFAWLSLNATHDQLSENNAQLQIDQQGQITDRYNAAVTNLGSSSVDVRLGGIYALQRIMQDSPRDQPTVVAVLCAFVRDHASGYAHPPDPAKGKMFISPLDHPSTDVQAALNVVGTRNTAHDGSVTVVDLSLTHLAGADFHGANLSGANFTDSDLDHADFTGANLSKANLSYTDLTGEEIPYGINLSGADLFGASLSNDDIFHANLAGVNLAIADLVGANFSTSSFTQAILTGANLTNTVLEDVNLSGANVTGADLAHADLKDSILIAASFSGANLTDAILTGTNRTKAIFSGADLSGVRT